jgi:hypothetical protein
MTYTCDITRTRVVSAAIHPSVATVSYQVVPMWASSGFVTARWSHTAT